MTIIKRFRPSHSLLGLGGMGRGGFGTPYDSIGTRPYPASEVGELDSVFKIIFSKNSTSVTLKVAFVRNRDKMFDNIYFYVTEYLLKGYLKSNQPCLYVIRLGTIHLFYKLLLCIS